MASPQERYNWIMARFDEGKTVIVSTYLKALAYNMFRFYGGECFAQNGKSWNCIDGCNLTAR